MTSVAKLLVAIYARYSTDMQNDRSTAEQINECREFAARQGWEVVLVAKDDAVRSGATVGRTGWEHVIAAAKAGEIQIVLLWRVDRYSRDFLDGILDARELTLAGAQLADTKSGVYDLNTPQGRIMLSIALSGAQEEVRNLGDRVRRAFKGKAIDGFSTGGAAPFGYRRVPEYSTTERDVDGREKRIGVRFAPCPITAPIVRRIFDAYRAGASKHRIAAELNRDGVRTSRAGRTSKARSRPFSGLWTAAQIGEILCNERYAGVLVYNRTSRTGPRLPSGKKQQVCNPTEQWIRCEVPALRLVDDDVWKDVQARLVADHAKYTQQHNANGHTQYLLSGLLRCSACGRSYVIGARYRGATHYRCSGRAQSGEAACSNDVTVSRPALEARIRDVLDVLVKDPRQLAALVELHNEKIDEANEQQLATLAVLEERIASARQQRDRLLEAIESGSSPPRSLVERLETREREIDDMSRQLDRARAGVLPHLVAKAASIDGYVTGSASLFTGSQPRDRSLLEAVLKEIMVYPNGSVVLCFRTDGLFAPLERYQLGAREAEDGSSARPLDARRRAEMAYHRHLGARGVTVVEHGEPMRIGRFDVLGRLRVRGPGAARFGGRIVAVRERPGGDDDEPGGDGPVGHDMQIALASPAGFEPASRP